ncbi:uncharacterized protein LOC127261732 [Andrographis paniculata]|uniref:uncharacterized protein LOC127261732 n=1 Tax=Andrographis paniculata TaxID=175694 RepID=UPI0021E9AE5F|nr:uncharacterized protein LOC127261732 [Andrographis paniculata]
MQNLVQDLQDELEMKEMLMVKELPDEGHSSPEEHRQKSPPTHDTIASPSGVKLFEFDMLKLDARQRESLELLSTIEAELQAELETLENNMKSTSAVDPISGVVELDPDFEPEIVRGDLKPAKANAPSESITESTSTTMDCSQPANYSVSPWELSLRLHELIESRLETRIKELETALIDNPNHTLILDSPTAGVFSRKVSRSETESSSDRQSPTCICDDESEDALSSSDKHPNGFAKERDIPGDLIRGVVCSDKLTSASFVSNVDSESDDGGDGGSGESEMMLIRRIVERRRSSSNFKLEIDWEDR